MLSFEGNEKKAISVGAWGGQGGSPWDDGIYSTIRQIIVVHAAAIDSIQIEYDKKGTPVWSVKHGGNGGYNTDKIKLDYPDEVLNSISGHHGSISNGSPIVIRSLTFGTNRTIYGPFGFQQGTHFTFPMIGGKIVGFHGRSGWYIDSIGVYLKHLHNPNPSKAMVTSQSFDVNGTSDTIGYNVVQGSVGKGYDIVLAVREKEDNSKFQFKNMSRETSRSRDFTQGETKTELIAFPKYNDKGSIAIGGGPITYGPWGGNGGTIFDDGVYTGVRQINLTRNAGITSIKVQYDRNGQAIWGNKHGGSGGIRTDKIIFSYPYEALTHIVGYYGTTMFMGPTAIKSLTFHTTKGKYGPYGDEQGIFFSSSLAEGMIVGFHGRKGWYIDSIGVHVLEGKLDLPPYSPNSTFNKSDMVIAEVDNPQWSNKLVLARRGLGEEVIHGVVKEPAPCGPGPWGGEGGRPWDDGVFSGIKQIFLTRGEAIYSIQIEYDRNGQSVWSTKHGGVGGSTTHRIQFEYPNEVLSCISGYYNPMNRDERSKVVTSLTFYTSRGKYGPFGEEIGNFFTSTTTEGKVVGFHGRCALYLDAIGVHMQHWLGEKKVTKSMLSKFFS